MTHLYLYSIIAIRDEKDLRDNLVGIYDSIDKAARLVKRLLQNREGRFLCLKSETNSDIFYRAFEYRRKKFYTPFNISPSDLEILRDEVGGQLEESGF